MSVKDSKYNAPRVYHTATPSLDRNLVDTDEDHIQNGILNGHLSDPEVIRMVDLDRTSKQQCIADSRVLQSAKSRFMLWACGVLRV